MSADYKVQRLYDEYIHDIVSSADNWKNFLRITGRIYRYEFDNILMVYAQRPNATLVGDYDSWKKVGRYVKRGSRGIAIFPSKILKPHMRYIFDISDTGGKNVKLTWDLNGDNLKSLVEELTEEGKIEPYLNENREVSKEANEPEMPSFAVKVTPYEREGSNIKGLARIYLDDSFVINNVSVIQGKNDVFVAMPSYKTKQTDKEGKAVYQDICFPITKEFRERLYGEIVETYKEEKAKALEGVHTIKEDEFMQVPDKEEGLPIR